MFVLLVVFYTKPLFCCLFQTFTTNKIPAFLDNRILQATDQKRFTIQKHRLLSWCLILSSSPSSCEVLLRRFLKNILGQPESAAIVSTSPSSNLCFYILNIRLTVENHQQQFHLYSVCVISHLTSKVLTHTRLAYRRQTGSRPRSRSLKFPPGSAGLHHSESWLLTLMTHSAQKLGDIYQSSVSPTRSQTSTFT